MVEVDELDIELENEKRVYSECEYETFLASLDNTNRSAFESNYHTLKKIMISHGNKDKANVVCAFFNAAILIRNKIADGEKTPESRFHLFGNKELLSTAVARAAAGLPEDTIQKAVRAAYLAMDVVIGSVFDLDETSYDMGNDQVMTH